MPYIKLEDRMKFEEGLQKINPKNAGELNYVISRILQEYTSNPNYQKFNDVMGALEGAKLEIYRRSIALYEDKKIKENGDL